MKMNEFDILEECLQVLENGQTVDEILARYPEQARKLRPLLNTAIKAKSLGTAPVPAQFQKRDRNHLIQHAAEMREARRVPRRMIPFFPRLAITLGVVVALVLSGTGLVSASASAIPGDQLYPVKRTWEDVRLMFVFAPQAREVLQSQYQQERLNEIDSLLTMGRGATPITFAGIVTHQQDGSWTVSGIPVAVNNSTILPSSVITASAPVEVDGVTRKDGTVEAQEIQLLGPFAPLPPFEPSEASEHNKENGSSSPSAPITQATPGTEGTSTSKNRQPSYEFSGVVESMQNDIWTINGQTVHVDRATVNGNVQVGSSVRFQGYYDANGQFIASDLTVTSSEGESTSTSTPHRNNNNNNGGDNNKNSSTQGSGENEGGGEGGGGGTPTGGDH